MVGQAAQQVSGADLAIEILGDAAIAFVAFRVLFCHTAEAARQLNAVPLGAPEALLVVTIQLDQLWPGLTLTFGGQNAHDHQHLWTRF